MAAEETKPRKAEAAADALSPRDRAILDAYAAGTSMTALAEQHGISRPRVSQIVHSPPAVAYLAQHGNIARTLLFARAGGELLARFDWGGVKMSDLIAVWKAAMPQEVSVNVAITEAARILAERKGLTPEQTAAIIDLASRRKAS